jgi:hypothetical protein
MRSNAHTFSSLLICCPPKFVTRHPRYTCVSGGQLCLRHVGCATACCCSTTAMPAAVLSSLFVIILSLSQRARAHTSSKDSWPNVQHVRKLLDHRYSLTSSVSKLTGGEGQWVMCVAVARPLLTIAQCKAPTYHSLMRSVHILLSLLWLVLCCCRVRTDHLGVHPWQKQQQQWQRRQRPHRALTSAIPQPQ